MVLRSCNLSQLFTLFLTRPLFLLRRLSGQVGVALGVAAITAAAVSSGIAVKPSAAHVTTPTIVEDNFVPPVCSASSLLKEGYVELQIAGLTPDALPDKKLVLEVLFRDLYNDITVSFTLWLCEH